MAFSVGFQSKECAGDIACVKGHGRTGGRDIPSILRAVLSWTLIDPLKCIQHGNVSCTSYRVGFEET